jgi:hypothetical protein
MAEKQTYYLVVGLEYTEDKDCFELRPVYCGKNKADVKDYSRIVRKELQHDLASVVEFQIDETETDTFAFMAMGDDVDGAKSIAVVPVKDDKVFEAIEDLEEEIKCMAFDVFDHKTYKKFESLCEKYGSSHEAFARIASGDAQMLYTFDVVKVPGGLMPKYQHLDEMYADDEDEDDDESGESDESSEEEYESGSEDDYESEYSDESESEEERSPKRQKKEE